MAHISKRKMPKRHYQKVRGNFIRALFRYRKGEYILNSLLTKTEKIMLAKRLAIIIMLEENRSHYSIVQTLKISPSTPKRIERLMPSGIFAPIQNAIRGKNTSALDLLEVIVAMGMPSIAGPRETRRMNMIRKRMKQ